LNSGTAPWTTPSALFCDGSLQDRVSRTSCPSWLWTMIFLISVSWLVRITRVSNWHPEDYHIFWIYSSFVGCLGCFHSLAIVNNATVNLVCRCLYCFLTYIPLAISIGEYCWSIFSFLRSLQSVFCSACINSHFHQPCMRVSFPHIFTILGSW
jgi:hypothetical protein